MPAAYWVVARWAGDHLGSADDDGVFSDCPFERERDAWTVAYALNSVDTSRPWRVQEIEVSDE